VYDKIRTIETTIIVYLFFKMDYYQSTVTHSLQPQGGSSYLKSFRPAAAGASKLRYDKMYVENNFLNILFYCQNSFYKLKVSKDGF
jgi:hypothetical protein